MCRPGLHGDLYTHAPAPLSLLYCLIITTTAGWKGKRGREGGGRERKRGEGGEGGREGGRRGEREERERKGEREGSGGKEDEGEGAHLKAFTDHKCIDLHCIYNLYVYIIMHNHVCI